MLECLLEKNERDRQLALEDAYNLHDACSRLAHETHVKTFSQILSGEVCVCMAHIHVSPIHQENVVTKDS